MNHWWTTDEPPLTMAITPSLTTIRLAQFPPWLQLPGGLFTQQIVVGPRGWVDVLEAPKSSSNCTQLSQIIGVHVYSDIIKSWNYNLMSYIYPDNYNLHSTHVNSREIIRVSVAAWTTNNQTDGVLDEALPAELRPRGWSIGHGIRRRGWECQPAWTLVDGGPVRFTQWAVGLLVAVYTGTTQLFRSV